MEQQQQDRRSRGRPPTVTVCSRETAEKIYRLIVAGDSSTIIAQKLNVLRYLVLQLRNGKVRRFRFLYEEYRREIPLFPHVHFCPPRPRRFLTLRDDPFLNPYRLYDFLQRHSGLGFLMNKPDPGYYRELNRIRRDRAFRSAAFDRFIAANSGPLLNQRSKTSLR